MTKDEMMPQILRWLSEGKSEADIKDLLGKAAGLAGTTGTTGAAGLLGSTGGKIAGGLGIGFLLTQLLGEGGNLWLTYRQQEMEKQARKNQALANAQMVNADAAERAADRRDAKEREATGLALAQQQMRMGDTQSFRSLLAGLSQGDPTAGLAAMAPDARMSRAIADQDAARILAANSQPSGFFGSIGLN